MIRIKKTLLASTLSLSSVLCFAAPTHFIVHNNSDYPTLAVINGVETHSTTAAGATKKTPWFTVAMLCQGQTQCKADVFISNAEKLCLGTAQLDTKTGAITPAVLSKGGYKMKVIGPAEVEFVKE